MHLHLSLTEQTTNYQTCNKTCGTVFSTTLDGHVGSLIFKGPIILGETQALSVISSHRLHPHDADAPESRPVNTLAQHTYSTVQYSTCTLNFFTVFGHPRHSQWLLVSLQRQWITRINTIVSTHFSTQQGLSLRPLQLQLHAMIMMWTPTTVSQRKRASSYNIFSKNSSHSSPGA